MSGFGAALRCERERRGISLDALSAETKVQLRHFAALEEDAFQELPGGVFRRGILRAYLHALALDEQAWLGRFHQSLAEESLARGVALEPGPEAWIEFAENVRKSRSNSRRPTDWRWLGLAGMLAMLALCGWAVWHFELQQLARR